MSGDLCIDGMRVRYIDPDFRPNPKTAHYCCACQRDLKPDQPHRMVMTEEPGFGAIHPDDHGAGRARGLQLYPMGMDCARKLGIDWTVAP